MICVLGVKAWFGAICVDFNGMGGRSGEYIWDGDGGFCR